MSECVVRMEKPKNCEECDMATKYQRFGTEIYCPFMGWYADYDKCPIILQLPEDHGRLVDADALLRDIEHYHVSDGRFQHWLELQPTIVPAERSEKK